MWQVGLAATAALSIKPTSEGVENTGSPPLPQWEAVSASDTVRVISAWRPGISWGIFSTLGCHLNACRCRCSLILDRHCKISSPAAGTAGTSAAEGASDDIPFDCAA